MSKNKNSIVVGDEIDLLALAKIIWDARKPIVKITFVFMLMGLFIAVFSEKEYTASTIIIPQSNEGISIGGSLGGLAAMAGFDLGGAVGESGIPPALYPQIFNSLHFKKKILESELKFNDFSEKVSYYDYLTKLKKPGVLYYFTKYTIGLPDILKKKIMGVPNNNNENIESEGLLSISLSDLSIFRKVDKALEIEINDRDGYISIVGRMPEALAAAQLTKNAQQLLQEFLQEIKSKKSKEQLMFIKERYHEKQKTFEVVQQELARFRDQNKNMNSAVSQSKLDMLESDYELAYGVYLELAKKLENQYIKVKEDSSIFTILQEVTVPVEKSKPMRLLILISWTFIGGLLGLIYVLIPVFLRSFKASS